MLVCGGIRQRETKYNYDGRDSVVLGKGTHDCCSGEERARGRLGSGSRGLCSDACFLGGRLLSAQRKRRSSGRRAGRGNKFQILALDGASITGGQGWLSAGLIRDFWERLLEPTAECTRRVGARGNRSELKKLLEDGTVLDLPGRTYALSPERYLALAFGYSDAELFPLVSEIGVMALGYYLRFSSGSEREGVWSEVKAIARAPQDSWRHTALSNAQGEGCIQPATLESLIAEIGESVDSAACALLEKPRQFLALRWVTRTMRAPHLIRHIERARAVLKQVVALGAVQNRIFDLDKIELLAGTSSGGLNALLFARHESFFSALDEAIRMWREMDEVLGSYYESLSCSKLPRLLGQKSFFGEILSPVYERYFADQPLHELRRDVAITALQLDSGEAHSVPTLRRWKPVIFHTFHPGQLSGDVRTDYMFGGVRLIPAAEQGGHLDDVRVRDVAIATSAAPMMTPALIGKNYLAGGDAEIMLRFPQTQSLQDFYPLKPSVEQSGFIDGGVFANNPSLMALLVAMSHSSTRQKLDWVSLVSMGNGRQAMDHIELKETDLGYLPWLASRERPGLLMNVMLDAAVDVTTASCRMLFRDRMKRYDVWTDKLYFANPFGGPGLGNIELQLDENLGVHRYLYIREPEELRQWLVAGYQG